MRFFRSESPRSDRVESCGDYRVTILNRRKYMRLIRLRLKTCEMKPRKFDLTGCKYLVMRGNKKDVISRGCRHYLMARLLDTKPLGPFRSGAEVLRASTIAGQEFKTGMTKLELDRFISAQADKCVWVHRFEDARVCPEGAVEWAGGKHNLGNCGYLSAWNKTHGCVRFKVLRGFDHAERADDDHGGGGRAFCDDEDDE